MHTPMRECIGCGKKFQRQAMLRIVKKDEQILIDTTGKSEGRGAYLCKNAECLEESIKRKKLNRAFKQNVSDDIYNKLAEEMRRLFE